MSLILAIIRTTPRARRTPSFENCLIPSRVPINAPMITASAKIHIASGRFETEEMCPSKPNTEFVRINRAAVPDAPLTEVQPKKMISGDKKIPPPVPVNPDSNPIDAPVRTEIATCGFFVSPLDLGVS